jgi:hypothetical protein
MGFRTARALRELTKWWTVPVQVSQMLDTDQHYVSVSGTADMVQESCHKIARHLGYSIELEAQVEVDLASYTTTFEAKLVSKYGSQAVAARRKALAAKKAERHNR